jgi:hypothetical protein
VHGGAGPEGWRKPESKTSESVSLWARGRRSHARFRGREAEVSGAPRRGRAGSQGADRKTEKLKNWKSEKLTSRPAKLARQDFRISGFHPSTCRPKICRLGPVGGWGGESPECSPNLPFPGYQGTSGMYCKQSFPCRALVGSLRPNIVSPS